MKYINFKETQKTIKSPLTPLCQRGDTPLNPLLIEGIFSSLWKREVRRDFKIKIKSISTFFILLSTSSLLLFLPACSKEKAGQQIKRLPVPVTVDSVIKKTVPVQLRAIGNIEAYSTVDIKARVAGELTHVYFSEGQDVNKGDLIFNIDSRPYKTALESAQANLARDIALAKKADEDAKRYAELIRDELVSRSQYEQVFANAEALKATVEADKAVKPAALAA